MAILANRGLRAAVEFALAAGVLLCGLAALPLGLESLASAPIVGAGYALWAASGQGEPIAPLCALAIRAFACLPVGDVATRANLGSLLAATLAARWLVRLVQELLAEAAPSPGAVVRESSAQATAALGGAACVTLGLGVFMASTVAAPAAVTLAVLAAFWLRAVRIVRTPGSTRDGLWLALWAGLGLGADPVVALICWPAALLLWLRALRGGERWPLVAPLLAVAGAGVALHGAVVAGAQGGMGGQIAGTLAALSAARDGLAIPDLLAPAAAALGETGLIGVLVACVGMAVLGARAPRQFVLFAVAVATAVVVGVGRAGSPGASVPTGAAWAASIAPIAIALAVGIDHLASKLGAARVPAAVVIAVVALAWPALDGGDRRWARPATGPDRLLREAHAAVALRGWVDPGSRSMEGLLHYGRALGLRPDVTLRSPRRHPTPLDAPGKHVTAEP